MKAALIGFPLGHSLSPEIHALISEITGIPCEYELRPMQPDEARGFIHAVPCNGVDGLNVTIPHKLLAYECVDVLSGEARAIGAVNTVEVTPGGLVGHNTDYHGFGAMLAYAGISVHGERCVILGSGGSARAAAAYLKEAGASDLLVASRDAEKAARKLPDVHAVTYEELARISGGLLVNCTPLGMHPHPEGCPVPDEVIGHFAAVADLVYNPRETKLLAIASRLGLRRADGLFMLAAQAVRAREIWHNAPMGEAVEREVYARLDARLRCVS